MTTVGIDWRSWLRRWDTQQESFLPDREERFTAMFDACEILLGSNFTAIDLASGPGSLTARLLERFPGARLIAVDVDPVLLTIGRGALGDAGGRLTWVDADLNSDDWPSLLPVSSVDAVLSTTALHWLAPSRVVALYGLLAGLIRPGGLFLNGDRMEYAPRQAAGTRLSEDRVQRLEDEAKTAGAETWDGWWGELRSIPALAALFAERERRFGARPAHAIVELHRAALLQAGFAEVDVIWQKLDQRIVMAVR